jgi:hypothetical protein
MKLVDISGLSAGEYYVLVFWNIRLCSLVDGYRRFGGTCTSTFSYERYCYVEMANLLKVANHLPHCMASH